MILADPGAVDAELNALGHDLGELVADIARRGALSAEQARELRRRVVLAALAVLDGPPRPGGAHARPE